jgi:hypothetical protein
LKDEIYPQKVATVTFFDLFLWMLEQEYSRPQKLLFSCLKRGLDKLYERILPIALLFWSRGYWQPRLRLQKGS